MTHEDTPTVASVDAKCERILGILEGKRYQCEDHTNRINRLERVMMGSAFTTIGLVILELVAHLHKAAG